MTCDVWPSASFLLLWCWLYLYLNTRMKQTTIGKIRDRNPMLKYLLKSQIVSFELTDLMLVQPSDSAWIMPDGELYKTSFNKGSTNWKFCWKYVSEVCPSSSRRFLDPFTISEVTILFVSELKVSKIVRPSPCPNFCLKFGLRINGLIHWSENKRSLKRYVDWSVDPSLKFDFIFS